MKRCTAIVSAIFEAWRLTNSFDYVFRATSSIHGKPVDQLHTEYFEVGVGNNVRPVPFIDMLVVMDAITKQSEAMESRQVLGDSFTVKYQIRTEFSDAEAARLLSSFEVETPFDEGKRLRVQECHGPRPDSFDA